MTTEKSSPMTNAKIEYNGEIYLWANNKWVNENYRVAPSSVQSSLNHLYFSNDNLKKLSVGQLIDLGNIYKNSSSENLAILCYKQALEKADDNRIKYILPMLTSCLRRQGKAKEVISIFSDAKKHHGAALFNPALLTSVAAAFCDLYEYDNAKKCCDRAYALSNGKPSGELMSVYGRIKKESNLLE